jgi:hypothetical protein
MVLGTSTTPIVPYCELVIKKLPGADDAKMQSLKRISSTEYVSVMATLPPTGKAELDALYEAGLKSNNEALNKLHSTLENLWKKYQELTISQK